MDYRTASFDEFYAIARNRSSLKQELYGNNQICNPHRDWALSVYLKISNEVYG